MSGLGLDIDRAVERIRARDGRLHAFVCSRIEQALKDAERRRAEPPRSPLHGVPYSLKDFWNTAELPTTGCSDRYRNRIPDTNAPIYQVLDGAGAVLLGKTNASDLGLAVESQSYIGGTTANPVDLGRTAGGSSGGAAAAVADGMSTFDWGSDFGGSIRLPAAFCGIYGMRLSSEAWPVLEHFPEPPASLRYMNGQGPLTARLDVMRAVLRVTAPKLRTGSVRSFRPRGAFVYAPEGGAVGEWPSFVEDVLPRLRPAVGEIRHDHGLPSVLRAAGIAHAMYCSHLEDFLEQDTMTFFEGLSGVLSSLAFKGRFGDRRFHPRTAEVLLAIAIGRATLYRDRVRAERDAAELRRRVAELWDKGYVIVAPTTTFPAPRHGRAIRTFHIASFTMPGNVADATGLAVPFGLYPDGLPRSIQIWGPPGSEEELIDIAERIGR